MNNADGRGPEDTSDSSQAMHLGMIMVSICECNDDSHPIDTCYICDTDILLRPLHVLHLARAGKTAAYRQM